MSIPDFADASKSGEELFQCLPGQPCPPRKVLIQVTVADCSNDGAVSAFPFINSSISDAFNTAMSAVNESIGNIGFTEMFRTTEHQVNIYDRRQQEISKWEKSWTPTALGNPKPFPAAPAGTSSHEAGYSFDLPTALLNGSRGQSIINVLAQNGFVRDIMNHPTFGNDPVHFTHSSWGTLSDEQKRQAIADAQADFAARGLPMTPGTMPSMSAPRSRVPSCN
jgi:hypothetical protein